MYMEMDKKQQRKLLTYSYPRDVGTLLIVWFELKEQSMKDMSWYFLVIIPDHHRIN